ncbi:MAG: carboxylating nicotinate-nucleotide diphosphorylase [Nitrospirota bacterium]|nr:carboxylating nicotinate-nucleotide diphosphorylase [Nitrospirota bacterium]
MNPVLLRETVARALTEDLGMGDVTGGAFSGAPSEGFIVAEQSLVVAGGRVAAEVFAQVDPSLTVRIEVADGEPGEPEDVLLSVSGDGASLLAAERVALNLLQRMCGVATLTRQFVEAVEGTGCTIADTRKTTPGLRMLEKYAVRMGGGKNHRMGLDDGVLIKENHIAMAGSLEEAVRRVRARASHALRIEVETTTALEVEQALAAGADIIMLDNFELADMKDAVAAIAGRAIVEASGGVNLDTVRAIAETGVNVISVGRLTHSAPAAEISMDIVPGPGPAA